MKTYIQEYLLIMSIFIPHLLCSHERINVLMNPNSDQSLVNSVDFHPVFNQFCVTFTHNNQVILYQLEDNGSVKIIQILQNDKAKLSCPQHALFSKDGLSLIVANWWNQSFTVYKADENGVFQSEPSAIIPFRPPTDNFRPHGMAFSPGGNYLAVAYGAAKQDPRAVALYQVDDLGTSQVDFKLLYLLQENELNGIPKGIAFSPDGTCLLVTISSDNSVSIFDIDWTNKKVISVPRQVLKGSLSQISRPEDIKFTPDGNYCAVSNSAQDNVTFYRYDKKNNRFINEFPYTFISELSFPHGLSFSSDGKHLAVTQFGPVIFDDNDNLASWANSRGDAVLVYKIEK